MTPTARQDRGRSALAVLVGLSRFALFAALATYSGLLLIATAPVALGLTSTVVLTGSMQPAISPGDVVLSSRVPTSMLRPGQVLLVADPVHPGELLMHRYARIGPGGSIITRGDANRVEDSTPVPAANVRGVPRIRVPWVGMPIVWLRFGVPVGVRYIGGGVLLVLLLASLPRRTHASRQARRRAGRGHLPLPAPRVLRVRRTHAAAALAATCGLASQLTAPSANASFTAAAASPNSFTADASFYAATVRSHGPAGYWRGSGFVDAIGGGAAAVSGAVSPVAGVTPDGDDAAYLPSPGVIRVPKTTTGDVTVEFWFAASAGAGPVGSFDAGAPLVYSSNGTDSGNFGMSLSADGHLLAGTGSAATSTIVTATSASGGYADNAWHHVALVRKGSNGNLRLYIDGAQSATANGGPQLLDARDQLYFGVSGDFERYSGARFDDITVYADTLTAGEIAAHYAARSTGYAAAVAPDTPAGYWKLDDAAGTTAAATIGAAGSYIGKLTYAVAPALGSGSSVQLDQLGGSVTVPRLVADDLSIEFWFASTGGAGTGQWSDTAGLVDGDAASSADDFGIGLSETGRIVAGIGNPDTSIESGTGFNDGGWHHVAFTRARATGAIVLYVDGVQVAAHAGTGNTGALTALPTLTVGRSNPVAGASAASDASIDELAQYPAVFTPAQVAEHFARATP